MKKIIASAVLAFVATAMLTITGCNTAKGFGQDLQAGGQKIEKAANESQSEK